MFSGSLHTNSTYTCERCQIKQVSMKGNPRQATKNSDAKDPQEIMENTNIKISSSDINTENIEISFKFHTDGQIKPSFFFVHFIYEEFKIGKQISKPPKRRKTHLLNLPNPHKKSQSHVKEKTKPLTQKLLELKPNTILEEPRSQFSRNPQLFGKGPQSSFSYFISDLKPNKATYLPQITMQKLSSLSRR